MLNVAERATALKAVDRSSAAVVRSLGRRVGQAGATMPTRYAMRAGRAGTRTGIRQTVSGCADAALR
ncbi:hypothetical protein DIE23_06685 [Burkholderia sp. Bp9143]|nr:hypothetical protein DIE23_06685 [Burkholderia sp. Bp9143]